MGMQRPWATRLGRAYHAPHKITNEQVCHKILLLSQNLSDHTYTQEKKYRQNKASPSRTITPESPRGIRDLVFPIESKLLGFYREKYLEKTHRLKKSTKEKWSKSTPEG